MKPSTQQEISKLKRRQTDYLIVAGVLIFLDIVSTLVPKSEPLYIEGNPYYNAGAFVGSNFMIIISIFLFIAAYRTGRKLKSLKADNTRSKIDEMGKF